MNVIERDVYKIVDDLWVDATQNEQGITSYLTDLHIYSVGALHSPSVVCFLWRDLIQQTVFILEMYNDNDFFQYYIHILTH